MPAPIAGFTGAPVLGDVPLDVTFMDTSTNTPTSWLWTYGDGYTGAEQNPTHSYSDVGSFDVSLVATNGSGTTGSITKNYYVTTYEIVSTTVPEYIQVTHRPTKTATQFTCLGWVASPRYGTTNTLVLLAVADTNDDVIGTTAALRFELNKDGSDYCLAFSGSKSVLINKEISVDLNDGLWHMLGYICNDTGVMSYYVDGIAVSSEAGYERAYTTYTRQGGGPVWCPYLYEPLQSVSIFNWRYGSGVMISQSWINDLKAVDRVSLGL